VDRAAIESRTCWAIGVGELGRAEGLAFSPDAGLLAVAEADADRVSLWRTPEAGGPSAPRRVQVIEGAARGVVYPHGVDFSPDGRLLVVACREAATLTIYARGGGTGATFGPEVACRVRGRRSRLAYTDDVAFVPPDGRFAAALSLSGNAILFYRRRWWSRRRFARRPSFALAGAPSRLAGPDGLAFSPDGRLLAAANHGGGHVTLYARRARDPGYGPEPLAVLDAGGRPLSCPHSVAFSRDGRLLAASRAGGTSVVFWEQEPAGRTSAPRWRAAGELPACDERLLAGGPRPNPQEGGAQGPGLRSRPPGRVQSRLRRQGPPGREARRRLPFAGGSWARDGVGRPRIAAGADFGYP
jgi:WD40 repeat protein